MAGGSLLASCAGASAPLPTVKPAHTASPTPVATPTPGPLPWPEANRILSDTSLPAIPARIFTFDHASYGAVPDGITDNTAALKNAIADCNAHGGGHVVVPAGLYSTGAIHLLSNVDLHLEGGAVLLFNGNVNDYPLVLTRYAGMECINYSPMIYAYGQTNISLTGPGVLDASNTRPWNVGADFEGILEPLVAAGIPPAQRIVPRHGRLRSAFVEPYACTNVLIQGVTLRQSQFWQLHPTLCRNLTIDSVSTGDTTSLNSDGCDPESCDHVVIQDCHFVAGDDCIAIKSGRDSDGRRVNAPCENVVITRCTLDGPVGGIAFGSEMTGGIRNVYVYDVEGVGRNLQYMFYVKSNTRRGGYAVDIYFDSVRADHMRQAWIFAQMDYNGQTGPYLPMFGGWHLGHLEGDDDAYVLHVSGRSDSTINGVGISDSTFTNVHHANFVDNAAGVQFENVTINGVPA